MRIISVSLSLKLKKKKSCPILIIILEIPYFRNCLINENFNVIQTTFLFAQMKSHHLSRVPITDCLRSYNHTYRQHSGSFEVLTLAMTLGNGTHFGASQCILMGPCSLTHRLTLGVVMPLILRNFLFSDSVKYVQ